MSCLVYFQTCSLPAHAFAVLRLSHEGIGATPPQRRILHDSTYDLNQYIFERPTRDAD